MGIYVSLEYLKIEFVKKTRKRRSNCHPQSTCTHKGRRGTGELLNWNMVRDVSPIDSPCPS